jgi:ubiquinone/menaquinone biosynthesis C-methylase UbiE
VLNSRAADATYVLGRSDHETRRLMLNAELQAPGTRRLFVEAGLAAGMTVLDVGSGAGDVAFVAAELAGPTGRVIGVDTDGAILRVARARAAALGLANVAFLEGDARTAALPEAVDAVVGRFVLQYVRDPAEVLRAALAHLRPGGVVAWQEVQWLAEAPAYPPSPLHDQWWRWMRQVWERGGSELAMGYKLHQVFLDAGLPAPRVLLHQDASGSPGFAWFEVAGLALGSVLPKLIEYGIATEEGVGAATWAERYRREVVGQRGMVATPLTVGAWTRKP